MSAVDTAPAEDSLDPNVWRISAVVLLGPLMAAMDSTVVNVSLSTIRQQLHASIDAVQWIVSGYLLALALVLPLNSWLIDRLGAKRLYLGCFSAFTLASLLCGSAATMNELIWARILQGIAGGLLAPMTQMMIARAAGRHMARVAGYISIPVLLAPILGPVVAGAILKYASWPWLFYINLPVGILAVTLAVFLLPEDEAHTMQKRPFDFMGFLLISPGLAGFLYGLDHIAQPQGFLVSALGLLLLGAFVWHALRRREAALLDLQLFRNPIFATASATQFLSNGATFAGQLLVPLFLIAGCGFSPAAAGWMLAPMGLGMLCIYPSMGFLTDRFGCRAVSAGGTALAILGTLPFLWMVHGTVSQAVLIVSLFARGAGQGAIGLPSLSAAYASVPRDKLSLATTAANIVQRLGGPVATTLMAIVLARTTAKLPGPHAFMPAFIALTVLQLLVLGAASRLPVRIHQPR